MSKQVIVNFNMLIDQDGEEQRIQFDSKGHMTYETIDEHALMTLRYKEPLMEENDAYIDVKCTLKPNNLTIIRKGKVKGIQKYEVNKETTAMVIHEHGRFPYQIYTTELNYNRQSILLKYQLIFQKQVHGHFEMNIEITESKE